eukprot:8777630-Ditylum_brightwellii.AAC.1
MATLHKDVCNTSPLKKPAHFGEGFHFDIVYGTGTAIGGYSDKDIGQAYISGAQESQQNQNGLPEIKWCHGMNMVRNWLTSNYLPKKF